MGRPWCNGLLSTCNEIQWFPMPLVVSVSIVGNAVTPMIGLSVSTDVLAIQMSCVAWFTATFNSGKDTIHLR